MEIRSFTDPILWNQFVVMHNGWAFFQSWEWGEVQKRLNHEVVRWGIFEKKELVGVAQIIIVEAKRGTFLHVRHGPVFAQNILTGWDFFIEKLRRLGKEKNADFIRISPMIEDSTKNKGLLKKLGFRPSPLHAMDAEVCWVLNVTDSEETLLSNMRKTTRYLIRHAQKAGIKIVESDDINKFLPLYTNTASRQEFVPHKGVKEEFEILSKAKKAHLLCAYDSNKFLAASLFIEFDSQLIYHHSASVQTNTGAGQLLQWHAIQLTKKLGLTFYNFWGIAPITQSGHPWRGITLFKQGFGGEEKRFLHAHDLPLTPFYLMTFGAETVRRLVRGY